MVAYAELAISGVGGNYSWVSRRRNWRCYAEQPTRLGDLARDRKDAGTLMDWLTLGT